MMMRAVMRTVEEVDDIIDENGHENEELVDYNYDNDLSKSGDDD